MEDRECRDKEQQWTRGDALREYSEVVGELSAVTWRVWKRLHRKRCRPYCTRGLTKREAQQFDEMVKHLAMGIERAAKVAHMLCGEPSVKHECN